MKRLAATLALLALAAGPATIQAPSHPAHTPAPGPPHIIADAHGGCIAGAVRLPDAAPGLQTIRAGKSSFWGMPETITHLLTLGERAQAAGFPTLYMGDISNPRGGPIQGGHISHQIGVDADVYLDITPHPPLTQAQRETLEPASLVRPDGRNIDPARWRPGHIALLKLAAGLPDIDRVLVNPAIKKALCEQVTGDRTWLRRIRPWYGHAAHMHLHFRCPANQPQCTDMPPPPPGDSCDASLEWWFTQLSAPAKPPGPPGPPPRIPAACAPIMAAPDG
jgi:penicillin-insensitive murein endopeptidase